MPNNSTSTPIPTSKTSSAYSHQGRDSSYSDIIYSSHSNDVSQPYSSFHRRQTELNASLPWTRRFDSIRDRPEAWKKRIGKALPVALHDLVWDFNPDFDPNLHPQPHVRNNWNIIRHIWAPNFKFFLFPKWPDKPHTTTACQPFAEVGYNDVHSTSSRSHPFSTVSIPHIPEVICRVSSSPNFIGRALNFPSQSRLRKWGGYTAATATIPEIFKIPYVESTEWFIIHVFYMTFLSQMSLISRFSNLHAATPSTSSLPSSMRMISFGTRRVSSAPLHFSFGTGSVGHSHLHNPVDFMLPVCISSGAFPMQHYILLVFCEFLGFTIRRSNGIPFPWIGSSTEKRSNESSLVAAIISLCLGGHSPARESSEHFSRLSAPAVLELSLFSRKFHGKEAERAPTVSFPGLHVLHRRLPIVVTVVHASFLLHSWLLSPRLDDHSAHATPSCLSYNPESAFYSTIVAANPESMPFKLGNLLRPTVENTQDSFPSAFIIRQGGWNPSRAPAPYAPPGSDRLDAVFPDTPLIPTQIHSSLRSIIPALNSVNLHRGTSRSLTGGDM
ncbi:hypothetical protein C8R45DRAFT_1115424 [Mycena sanguinolenta]|nr:hypothetical protein C8R45DRAFT_1115424 [Mycena sanguinolenta]